MKTLIIVESPNKTKKIEGYLGSNYRVVASVRHIRDLPPKDIGFEPPDFWPKYEEAERGRQVVRRLKAEVANADRITFNSITKEKVMEALNSARKIDMNMVRSQKGHVRLSDLHRVL